MVSKRGIPICGIVACLFFFVLSTASFADQKSPTACIKNNAGVVLKINQPFHGGVSSPMAIGQSIKVYTDDVTYLLCATMFGEYTSCESEYKDGGVPKNKLKDGQTLELTGTVFWLYTNITNNTCK
jgi:hypothetical protein